MADLSKILINGTAYTWADINVQLLGRTVLGISAISYEDMQEMVDNFGAGIFPISRGYGKNEAKASITLEAKELERLVDATPSGRVQDIPPFPITVSYVNPSNKVVTHKLLNCQFKGNKRASKSGDTNIEVELDLIITHIQWK
ncbi:hypothetical protein [Hymenobacter cavernae]|uniref:Phage tail protein n=1 Tax=Hymenobacter cavernae TaxID=2044852 RepID=A0ABQ1UPY5_9BACT|nr:hypothetical protein [Hymenobacter cavernae]GGF22260.1 hypothetical protein GCM10011383_37360 [Hymenobacter cavernae]